MNMVLSISRTDARMVDGLILSNVQLDGVRNGGLELRQGGANAVHRLDNVRTGLPVDSDVHRGLAVGYSQIANILD